jgi:hypothetical protein
MDYCNSKYNSYTFIGLDASTSYEFQVETWCTAKGSSNSPWSELWAFTTTAKIGSHEFVTAKQMMSITPNPTADQTSIHISLFQSSHVSGESVRCKRKGNYHLGGC